MGFLSRDDIVRAIDGGLLRFESDQIFQIGESCIDISLGSLYERNPLNEQEFSDLLYREEFHGVKATFSDYMALCRELPFRDGYETVDHRNIHYAESVEISTIPNFLIRRVTPRSSPARLFLWIKEDPSFDANFSKADPDGIFHGRIPMIINTLGPGVKLYKNVKYPSLFLRDSEPYLIYDSLLSVVDRGEISVQYPDSDKTDFAKHHRYAFPQTAKWLQGLFSRPSITDKKPVLYEIGNTSIDYWNSKILISLFDRIEILTGDEPLDPNEDNSHRFSSVDLPSYLEKPLRIKEGTAFIASTREKIRISENYIGETDTNIRFIPGYGLILHPDCPYHKPGSDSQLILECYAISDIDLFAGMPVGGIRVYRMNSPTTYIGRYSGQMGITHSKAHQGL